MHHITSDHIFTRSGQCYTLRILIELLKNLSKICTIFHHAPCRVEADAKAMTASLYRNPDSSPVFL